MRVLTTLRKAKYTELAVFFFIPAAAFVSPLIFGATVDRHLSPVKLLRGLALAAANLQLAAFRLARLWAKEFHT